MESIPFAQYMQTGKKENAKIYVAVILQKDTQNQRLYLHDVVTETEKELSASSNEHLNTTGPKATSKELYTTNILPDALRVKRSTDTSGGKINTKISESGQYAEYGKV